MIFPYVGNVDIIHNLESRLDSLNNTDNLQLRSISEYRLSILQWVSLGLAGVSVFSTLFALYWFVRMRRSFRHDLILLLIQADLFKSVWFVIFPIVEFSSANTQDGSAFCETSGFFLSTGIEASDIAVLLISLHTAIYVFSPSRPSGQNGLYPYRRLAYVVYVGFPLLMASLAFSKGPTGYRNVGDACYLDATDDWHRMYLSWVPRYIIFSIIFILHLGMYIYIRILLGHFSRKDSSAPSAFEGVLPPTPPLECHGLIPPPAHESRRPSALAGSLRLRIARSFKLSLAIPSRDRISSSPATMCVDSHTIVAPGDGPVPSETTLGAGVDIQRPPPVFDAAPGQPSMHRFRFSQSFALNRTRSESRLGPYEVSTSSLVNEPIDSEPPASPRQCSNASNFPLGLQTSTESFYRRPILYSGDAQQKPTVDSDAENSTRRPSIVPPTEPLIPQPRHISPSLLNLLTILRRGPSSTITSGTLPQGVSFSQETSSSGLMSSRMRTRRQLRLLFVYPLAYVATWSLPFISHLLRYDDHNRPIAERPFWILLASSSALCLQGTVDSVLFMLQVRPWRHVRRDMGFWASLGARFKVKWRWREDSRGGRTTEDRRDGERLARVRREAEAAHEVAVREERERSVNSGERIGGGTLVVEPDLEEIKEKRMLGRKGGRNWWDVELDGIFDHNGDEDESSDDDDQDGLHNENHEKLDIEKGAGRLDGH